MYMFSSKYDCYDIPYLILSTSLILFKIKILFQKYPNKISLVLKDLIEH